MFLLLATSVLLFCLFQLSPTMHGPVGAAFAVSMAVLGAISLLHWMHESSKGKSTGLLSNPMVQGQLHGFMNLPTVAKLAIVLIVLALPIAVGAIA